MDEETVTGILWWKPKQWEKAKRISADSQEFDDTYQEWKEAAEKALKNFRDLRITAYKVEIDLDEYIDWSKKQNIALNAESRTRFVSMKVKDLHESRTG